MRGWLEIPGTTSFPRRTCGCLRKIHNVFLLINRYFNPLVRTNRAELLVIFHKKRKYRALREGGRDQIKLGRRFMFQILLKAWSSFYKNNFDILNRACLIQSFFKYVNVLMFLFIGIPISRIVAASVLPGIHNDFCHLTVSSQFTP